MIFGSDPDAPSFGTLRKLHGMLPSLAKDLASGKMKGKGGKLAKTRPRKMCRVCCKTFDLAACPDDTPLTPSLCDECEPVLKDGYVAIVSGDKFAFIKHESLTDLGGTVQHVSIPVFEQFQAKFEAAVKERQKDEKGEA